MKIDIPLPCPKCNGKMYSVNYEVTLSILKNRSWQICKECNFERSTEEFKKSICCAWFRHKFSQNSYILLNEKFDPCKLNYFYSFLHCR